MDATETTYAVASEAEYYGPETRRNLLADETTGEVTEYATLEAAQEAADTYDPDYEAERNVRHLRHNQASPTRGIVVRRVGVIDTNDWDTLPADLYDAAAEKERGGTGPEEALAKTMDELGYLCHDDTLYQIV